jgi:hypothetical protein
MKKAMQRVSAIPPLGRSDGTSSFDADLAREYLRRAALMAKSLPNWEGGPFFNPAVVTLSDLSATLISEIEAVITSDSQPNGFVRRICRDYIKWQAYIDKGNPVATSFPEVYEPLLKLFERGQSFGMHHGELIIGGFSIPLESWLDSSEMPAFNLDETIVHR